MNALTGILLDNIPQDKQAYNQVLFPQGKVLTGKSTCYTWVFGVGILIKTAYPFAKFSAVLFRLSCDCIHTYKKLHSPKDKKD